MRGYVITRGTVSVSEACWCSGEVERRSKQNGPAMVKQTEGIARGEAE